MSVQELWSIVAPHLRTRPLAVPIQVSLPRPLEKTERLKSLHVKEWCCMVSPRVCVCVRVCVPPWFSTMKGKIRLEVSGLNIQNS